MKQASIVSIILISLNCAKTIQVKNQENLFENCMKTFQDESKCKEFIKSSAKDLQSEEERREEELAKLSAEQLAGLKLRKEIKDTLPGKNGLFVKSYLGDPDEIKRGGDREYWVYTRPLSKYEPDSVPDKEITVIFRRSFVEKVDYKKP